MLKDAVSSRGSGTVGTFGDDLSLDAVGIFTGENTLGSSRNQNVTFFLQKITLAVSLSAWESHDGSIGDFVVFKGLGVNAILAVDSSIDFFDTNALSTSTAQITRRVKTDITETLNNKSLITKTGSQTDHAHVGSFVDEVFNTMPNSSTGSRNTTVNTSLRDGLASDTSTGVQVQTTICVLISI